MKMRKNVFCVCLVCLLVAFGGACNREKGKTAEELLQSAVTNADTDWSRSLDDAKEAYKLNSEDTSIQVIYALALDNTGRKDDALKISSIAANNNKSFVAQYLYGRLLFRSGDYEHALAPLKLAHELNPGDEDALLLLVRTASLLNHDDTEMYCNKLNRLFQSNGTKTKEKKAYVYNELGIYYAFRKNEKRKSKKGKEFTLAQYAKSAFGAAAKQLPESPEICFNQAIIADYYLKNKREAIELYKKYLSIIEENKFSYEQERLLVNQRLESLR